MLLHALSVLVGSAARRVAELVRRGLCWDCTVTPLHRESRRAGNKRLVILHIFGAERWVHWARVKAVGLPVYWRRA